MKRTKTYFLGFATLAVVVSAILSIFVFTIKNRNNVMNNNREYLVDTTKQMASQVDTALSIGYTNINQLEKLLTIEVFGDKVETYLCNEEGKILASNENIDTTADIQIETIIHERSSEELQIAEIDESPRLISFDNSKTSACIMKLENSEWYIMQVFPEKANARMVASANQVGIGLAVFHLVVLTLLLILIYFSLDSSRKASEKALLKTTSLNEQLEENQKKLKELAKEQEVKMEEITALNAELEKAQKEADSSNKAKTTFLFNMSHDIRTPMNAIVGYTQLMKKDSDKPDKVMYYLDKMEQASDLLLNLINNVLDMARIESGRTELDENYNYSGDIIIGVLEVFEVAAKKKNLKIVHSVNVEHRHIICDKIKLQEIFTNLISNAVKYTTDGGTITITTSELPSDKEGVAVFQTVIEDTGIGMSKEFLPYLFEAFAREKNTTAGKVAGTGLGMPIVKGLIELMGGTIDVESELGVGSRFIVTLSHKIADEKYYKKDFDLNELKEAKLQGRRILMAEDNELNAEIAIAILEEAGFVVDRAEDGIICVDKLEQAEAGTYDLILMDIQMPNMDGYKATQIIRQLPDKRKAEIPIVAITANAFDEDRNKAFETGMNGHIAKPINVAELIKELETILEGKK